MVLLVVFVAADLIGLGFLLAPVFKPAEPAMETTQATQAQTQPAVVQSIVYDDTTQPQTAQAPAHDTLTISFVGDCMFASNHGAANPGSFNRMAQSQPPEYFLKNFIPMFQSDDFTIANCECVLSDDETLTEKEVTTEIAFWFKGAARHADIFRVSGVELASVVNNHSHDFGQKGSDDTEAALERVGVLPGRREKVTYTTVKGQKLGIYCCSLYSHDYVYNILDKVGEMKQEQCDLIILYFHGGIENETVPEDWKVRACHELIDAGADVIVGSHPHVLQPMEVYRGKPILYSLGNFCFGGNTHPPRNTAVYQAVFQVENGQIGEREDVLIPCATYSGGTNNYQPYIVTNESTKQEILGFMHSPVAF